MKLSIPTRKPLFTNPILTLVFTTITLSLASAFITLKVIEANNTDHCAIALGRARVEINQSQVPSVFDEQKWVKLTAQYDDVFTACDAETAAKYATDEFNPWAAPALEAFSPQGSVPASSPAAPSPGSSVLVPPVEPTMPATTVE